MGFVWVSQNLRIPPRSLYEVSKKTSPSSPFVDVTPTIKLSNEDLFYRERVRALTLPE